MGELERTYCGYIETGVSPSIGSWTRTINVTGGFRVQELARDEDLRAAIREIEEAAPKVVIDPPLKHLFIPPGTFGWWRSARWENILGFASTVLLLIWMLRFIVVWTVWTP